jgi:DNA-binding winged helix-turn-helix (wHTH) protein
MQAPPDQVFAFGNFILIPKERLLLYGGEFVPLTGEAFDLLVLLLRRSGHLVTKDEIFEEVWPTGREKTGSLHCGPWASTS